MEADSMHNPSDDGIDMKSDDLITRLEEAGRVGSLCWEAADEIERLRYLVARLDNALSDIKHLTADPGVLHRIKEARRD